MTQDFQDFNEYAYEVEGAPEEETVTLATPGDRLLAWIVDLIIWFGIGIWSGIILIGGQLVGRGNFWFELISLGLILLIVLGFLAVILAMIARDGQSPGKKVVKIRILSTDGSTWGWRGTLVRELLSKIVVVSVVSSVVGWLFTEAFASDPLGIVGTLVYLALFIWIVIDENNQTLHDKIANTYVVKVS